jgi:hypothetical protein
MFIGSRWKHIPIQIGEITEGWVVALDVGVGKVLRTLQTNNLLDNTLIFFLSDNGAYNTGFTMQRPHSRLEVSDVGRWYSRFLCCAMDGTSARALRLR